MAKQKKKWAILALLLLAVLLVTVGPFVARHISTTMRGQGAVSVRAAVMRAAVQCYAVEGSYPQTLQYLEEKYGVQVNRDIYIVTYDAFAANLIPEVAVLLK